MDYSDIIRLHLGSYHAKQNWMTLEDPKGYHIALHETAWLNNMHLLADFSFDLTTALKNHDEGRDLIATLQNRAQKESVQLFTDKEKQLLGELVSNVLYLVDQERIPKYVPLRKHSEYIESITTTNGFWLRRVLNNLAKEVNSKDKS